MQSRLINPAGGRWWRYLALALAMQSLPWTAWAVGGADKAGAAKPSLTPDVLGTGSVLQMLAGLAVVVGLVFGLAWFMRRFGRLSFGGSNAVRVVGALSMGARERVVLVQAGETQVLVGVAPGRVQTLHVLDKPVDVDQRPGGAQAGFAERLRQVMSRGGSQ
jgi:flagellar protein FliO/FliZ